MNAITLAGVGHLFELLTAHFLRRTRSPKPIIAIKNFSYEAGCTYEHYLAKRKGRRNCFQRPLIQIMAPKQWTPTERNESTYGVMPTRTTLLDLDRAVMLSRKSPAGIPSGSFTIIWTNPTALGKLEIDSTGS